MNKNLISKRARYCKELLLYNLLRDIYVPYNAYFKLEDIMQMVGYSKTAGEKIIHKFMDKNIIDMKDGKITILTEFPNNENHEVYNEYFLLANIDVNEEFIEFDLIVDICIDEYTYVCNAFRCRSNMMVHDFHEYKLSIIRQKISKYHDDVCKLNPDNKLITVGSNFMASLDSMINVISRDRDITVTQLDNLQDVAKRLIAETQNCEYRTNEYFNDRVEVIVDESGTVSLENSWMKQE